jgi:hypothetical protein
LATGTAASTCSTDCAQCGHHDKILVRLRVLRVSIHALKLVISLEHVHIVLSNSELQLSCSRSLMYPAKTQDKDKERCVLTVAFTDTVNLYTCIHQHAVALTVGLTAAAGETSTLEDGA